MKKTIKKLINIVETSYLILRHCFKFRSQGWVVSLLHNFHSFIQAFVKHLSLQLFIAFIHPWKKFTIHHYYPQQTVQIPISFINSWKMMQWAMILHNYIYNNYPNHLKIAHNYEEQPITSNNILQCWTVTAVRTKAIEINITSKYGPHSSAISFQ